MPTRAVSVAPRAVGCLGPGGHVFHLAAAREAACPPPPSHVLSFDHPSSGGCGHGTMNPPSARIGRGRFPRTIGVCPRAPAFDTVARQAALTLDDVPSTASPRADALSEPNQLAAV